MIGDPCKTVEDCQIEGLFDDPLCFTSCFEDGGCQVGTYLHLQCTPKFPDLVYSEHVRCLKSRAGRNACAKIHVFFAELLSNKVNLDTELAQYWYI